jgi:hypothetical protein
MRIRRVISWSVPRLRGRGEQGEIVRKTRFVPALYTVLRRAAAAHLSAEEPDKSQARRTLVLCLQRPRKRGALHVSGNLSRPRCRQPDSKAAALAFLAGHSK